MGARRNCETREQDEKGGKNDLQVFAGNGQENEVIHRPNIPLSEAARLLGLGPQALRNWRKRGWLTASKLPNGRYVITQEELDRLKAKPGQRGEQ